MYNSLRASCSEAQGLLKGVIPNNKDFPFAVVESSFEHGNGGGGGDDGGDGVGDSDDGGDGDDQVATGQDGAAGGETLLSPVRRSCNKGFRLS